MAADNAEHPSSRHATFRKDLLHLEEHVGVHFVATPTPGLENPEKTRVVKFPNGFPGHIALCDTRPRPRLERRHHRVRTLDQRVR
jgi:hypothetical protein